MILTAMKRFVSISLLLAGLWLGSAVIAGAQTYNLSWYTIAGGGGTSTGTNTASNVVYSVSGTIGQSDAGYMAGGNYSLTGGFWGIIATVQTPGAPFLFISGVTNKNVTLSWAAAYTGFMLQQNTAANNTNTWVNVNTNTYPLVLSNGTNAVTVPVSGNQFFRLVNP